MNKINIFIVDDHQIFLDGISSLLEEEEQIQILGTAHNGKVAIDKIAALSSEVNVVLMDINMPEMDGIEATKQLKSLYPNIKILMLTMHSEPRFIKECIEIGAKGYVLKNISKDDLLKAIDHVNDNKAFLDSAAQEQLINAVTSSDDDFDSKAYDQLTAQITTRELEILQQAQPTRLLPTAQCLRQRLPPRQAPLSGYASS